MTKIFNKIIILILFFSVVGAFEIALAQDEKVVIKSGIPAEFMDMLTDPTLNESEKMVDLLVGQYYLEIYVDGVRRGDSIVFVNNNVLEFDDISQLVELLPDLRNREDFLKLYGSKINLNDKDYCVMSSSNICVAPKKDENGFILNLDDQRIDIFLSSKFKPKLQRVVPSHPSQSGVVGGLNARMSGFSGQTNSNLNGSLGFDILAGRGRTSAFAVGAMNTDGITNIYRAGIQTYHQDMYIAAGSLRSASSDILSQREILGVSIQSSEDTVLKTGRVVDTPVTLFLSNAAYIDVYRSSQLILSTYREAGTWRLPTKSFPDGSYPISIEIREEGGVVRSESQFFSRSSGINANKWNWSLLAGLLEGSEFRNSEENGFEDRSLVSLEAQRKMGQRSEFRFRTMLIDDLPLVEVGVQNYFDNGNLRSSIAYSGDGGLGVHLDANAAFREYNLGLNVRYDGFNASSNVSGFRDEKRGSVNLNASLPAPLIDGRIQGYARMSFKEGEKPSEYIGVNWMNTYPIAKSKLSAQLQLGYQRSSDEDRFLMSLRFTGRKGRSSYSGRASTRFSPNGKAGEEWFNTQNLNWSKRSKFLKNKGWSYGGNLTSNSNDDFRVGVRGSLKGPSYNIDGRVDQNWGNSKSTRYYGSASTSFALNSDGYAFSNRKSAKAGVLLDLRQVPEGVEVWGGVGSQRLETLKTGLSFIPISQFQPQNVKFRPKGKGAFQYQTLPLTVSAFPGNIVTLKPEFFHQVTIIGRIVDKNGHSFQQGRIVWNDQTYSLDETGFFVTDISSNLKSIQVYRGTQKVCDIYMPLEQELSENAFVDLGDLYCTEVDELLFAEREDKSTHVYGADNQSGNQSDKFDDIGAGEFVVYGSDLASNSGHNAISGFGDEVDGIALEDELRDLDFGRSERETGSQNIVQLVRPGKIAGAQISKPESAPSIKPALHRAQDDRATTQLAQSNNADTTVGWKQGVFGDNEIEASGADGENLDMISRLSSVEGFRVIVDFFDEEIVCEENSYCWGVFSGVKERGGLALQFITTAGQKQIGNFVQMSQKSDLLLFFQSARRRW